MIRNGCRITAFCLPVIAGMVPFCTSAAAQGPVVCEAPTVYGAGTAGHAGAVPTLDTYGRPPRVGDAGFGIDVASARPGSTVGLIVARDRGFATALGVDLWIDLATVLTVIPKVTNATGWCRFDLPVPPSSNIVGEEFTAQLLVADPDGAAGISASAGLEFRVCDTTPAANLRTSSSGTPTCWAAQDPSCINTVAAVQSFVSSDGSSFEWVGAHLVVNERTTVTQVNAIGASIQEDYDLLDCELLVYSAPADGEFAFAPELLVEHQTSIGLRNTSPPAFGGTSPIGVPYRYLEFEIDEFELSPPIEASGPLPDPFGYSPSSYWVVIRRKDANENGLVFAATMATPGGDLATSDSLAPLWSDFEGIGLGSLGVAVDVLARTDCEGAMVDSLELQNLAITWIALASSVGDALQLDIGLRSTVAVRLVAWRDGQVESTHMRAEGPLLPLFVIHDLHAAASLETTEGAVSAWLVIHGATDWGQPVTTIELMTAAVCPSVAWWL